MVKWYRRVKLVDVKVNPTRQDPYNHFKFLVKSSGRTDAGISSIYVLNKSKEVNYHDKRDGENTPRISLRKAKYGAIILKRGLTYDLEFEKWVNEAPNNSRKDIIIEEIEELTKNVVAYRFFGC